MVRVAPFFDSRCIVVFTGQMLLLMLNQQCQGTELHIDL